MRCKHCGAEHSGAKAMSENFRALRQRIDDLLPDVSSDGARQLRAIAEDIDGFDEGGTGEPGDTVDDYLNYNMLLLEVESIADGEVSNRFLPLRRRRRDKSAHGLRRKDSGRDKERAANADDLQRIADKLDAFDPSDEDADPTEQQGKLDAIEKELDDMGEPDDDQTEERDAIAALRETIAAAQDVIDKRPDNRGEDDPHVEAGSGGDVEVGSYERNGHTVRAYSRSRRGGGKSSAHDVYSR